jgi:hypothetical protein
MHRAARGLEFVFQFLVLAAQPLAFGFRPPEVRFQLRDPARLVVDDLLRVTRRRLVTRHPRVMPDSPIQYKQNLRCLRASVARDQWRGRASRALTR